MKYTRKSGRRSYRRKYTTKRKVVKKALAQYQNKKIANVVNNVLSKRAETKVFQTYGSFLPVTLQPGITTLTVNAMCLTPASNNFTNCGFYTIDRGTGPGQRVGDEITVKAIYFKYQIIPTPYNATTNPIPEPMVVNIWFISPKVGQALGPDPNRIISGGSSNFFENTTGITSGLDGTSADFLRRVDRDNYELLGFRQHKVFWAGTSGLTGSLSSYYNYANNDFKFMSEGRIKLKGGKMAFDAASQNPQKRSVYAIYQVVLADGGVPPPIGRQMIDLKFNVSCYYSDM